MDSVLTAINDQHTPKFTLEHITWVRTLEFALSSIGRTEAEDPELYQRISPITGVAGLKTPLLIIHSDGRSKRCS